MNLFRFVKDTLAIRKARKALKVELKELAKKRAEYLSMTSNSLAALSDEELFQAARMRAEHIVDSFDDMEKGFLSLNNEQRILYALTYMEMEVANGGLCQFFVNSSRMVAPFISDYMAIVGADKHKELFDQFISRHSINLQDLTSFRIETIEDYQKQFERYPFDEYDDSFYELPLIEASLIPFVRNHVHQF